MRDTILISIHPEHVEKILSGEKNFEFRKKLPTHIKKAVIYSTKPVGEIVAVIDIKEVISDSPEHLWTRTKKSAGINHTFYKSYFKNRTTAYAIEIASVKKLATSISPKTPTLNLSIPQSYSYLNDQQIDQILHFTSI